MKGIIESTVIELNSYIQRKQMEKFELLQKEDTNALSSRETTYLDSYWYKISDHEKLEFNQEMLKTYIEIIEESLNFNLKNWEDFNEKMKDSKKLKEDLRSNIVDLTKAEIDII